MKEYDIFVPLNYNDGSPVETRKFQRLQRRLLAEFGGVTYFPQPNEGWWQVGDITYRDQIVIYRVLTDDAPTALRFLKRLKKQLKRSFEQEEILIIERDVKTH